MSCLFYVNAIFKYHFKNSFFFSFPFYIENSCHSDPILYTLSQCFFFRFYAGICFCVALPDNKHHADIYTSKMKNNTARTNMQRMCTQCIWMRFKHQTIEKNILWCDWTRKITIHLMCLTTCTDTQKANTLMRFIEINNFFSLSSFAVSSLHKII